MKNVTLFRNGNVPRAALALALSLTGLAGFAQDDTKSDEPVKLQRYTVTGSNIPTTLTADEAGTYPVVSIDRPAIERTGYLNAAELLQKITVSNAGAVPISNNATGFTPAATSVSLRGLGPDATLVLINGHRVANYPIGLGGNTAFVDLNSIPLAAIERVEVLKDGASAVYGADAVAGVVNIILRKNFNGTEAFVGYQNTTDKDSTQFTANLITGVSNDAGSLTIAFNYQRRNAIFNQDRAYSAVPAFLSTNSSPINLQITEAAYDEALGLPAGTLPAGVTSSVFYATPGPLTDDGLPTTSDNHGHVPPGQYIYSGGRSSVYNYNQDSMSFPSWTRYGLVLNGERKLFGSDILKGYLDGSYQSSTTENQLAPSATGSFTTAGQTELVIPARTPNPLPTADGRDRAAPDGAYNPFNPFNMDITGGTRFRTKEFGNRIFHDTNISFMGTVGVRADNIAGKFNLDAGFRYSEINYYGNDTLVSSSRFNRVLNAADPIFDPASSQYIGTTVPYNPFGYYVNPIPENSAVVNFATVHTHDQNLSSLGNGFVTVNTTSLFTIPGGDVGAAAGLDYRVESLVQSPDQENVAGDTIGGSATAATNHTRKVWAAYAEMQFPLASPSQNIPGLYSLSMDVAARYEGFLTSHDSTTVPKLGLRYQPFDDTLTFRGSIAKGFLEPSLYKLYAGSVAGLLTLVDPRDGNTLQEVPTVTNGNSSLKPETSKSYTLGVVWSPKGAMNGFTTNVDLWRIQRFGQALTNLQDTLDRFFGHDANGSDKPGGLQPGEAVLLDAGGGIAQVVTNYLNSGDYLADGIDFGASYVLPTDAMGRFDFAVGASYLHTFQLATLPNTPLGELVDTDNSPEGEGQDAYLHWKGRLDVTWAYRNFGANLAANYLDGYTDYDFNGDNRDVGSSVTWDLQFSYTLSNGWLKGTKLAIGSNNILNRHPPLVEYFGANSVNYSGFLYSAEDRLVYATVTMKF
ncbi:MAG TPA: TonB-dependent receptor [Opitutus sp.]|nr:TonB-dependent receptor [Opitutus sp.]